MEIQVTAPIRATEVPERVGEALLNLFDGKLTLGKTTATLVGTNVDRFRARVWEMRIIDAVRRVMVDGANDDNVYFSLDKQAAASGNVALPVGKHSLGHIDVHLNIDQDDPWLDGEELCWWICPATEDGEIIGLT